MLDQPKQPEIEISEHERLMRRYAELDDEAQSWMTHWREINSVLMPRSGRFFETDRNNGDRRHNNIYDSTGTRAVRVLGAGMMSGATSPARPWFRLATSDQDMMELESVQQYLYDVRRIMLNIFHRSNNYRSLHRKYEECGTFGTAASIFMDDFDTVIHDYGLTIGEYRLGSDYKGNVNTLGREFEKQVGQLVREFGYSNCSYSVQSMYDKGSYEKWVPVVHIVQPREFYDPSKRDPGNMPFQSVYIEKGARVGRVLRNSGFRDFRVIAPRWNLVAGNTYGEGQGMEALGDVKQLQHEQLRKAQGIDYHTNPPVQVPASMKNRTVDRLPGGISYYDGMTGPQGAIRNAFDVNIRLDHLLADIQDVRQRINQAFFTDMFLMIANSVGGPQQTATEIAEKHEEKMLMLGPVLENLHHEELQPRVNMCFDRALESDLLPPPPPELEGQELNVEFISVLAQAQRLVEATSTDRFVMSLGQIMTLKPEVVDKFDADEWADEQADVLGINPKLIVSNKEVAMVREQRAQAAQQAAQAEQMQMSADTAQKLGNTPVSQDNALGGIMSGLQGYT